MLLFKKVLSNSLRYNPHFNLSSTILQSRLGIAANFCSTSSPPEFPLKPKKPRNPFIQYLADFRLELLSKTEPNKMTNQEILKTGGINWRNMDPNLKMKYSQDYSNQLKDYLEQTAKYISMLTEEQKQQLLNEVELKKVTKLEKIKEKLKKKETKRLKKEYQELPDELKRPKRPTTSFLMYFNKLRSELPKSGLSRKEFLKKAAKDWEELLTEDRKKFTDDYRRDYEKYRLELSSWKRKVSELECPDSKTKKSSGKLK